MSMKSNVLNNKKCLITGAAGEIGKQLAIQLLENNCDLFLTSKNESDLTPLTKSLSKLSKNRTTIVIAHRLSTIVKADKILLLDAGKILEQGDHKSLIELNGEYSKMYSNQIKDLD